jgi:hypothetical protein
MVLQDLILTNGPGVALECQVEAIDGETQATSLDKTGTSVVFKGRKSRSQVEAGWTARSNDCLYMDSHNSMIWVYETGADAIGTVIRQKKRMATDF